MKLTPTTGVDSSAVASIATRTKPAWKSATLKERPTPSSMSSSSEKLDDIMLWQGKNRSRDVAAPPAARKPNPMTVSALL